MLQSFFVEKAHISLLDGLFVRADIIQNCSQVLVHVFVNPHLLVHVEYRQIIVYHQDGFDIVVGNTFL